MSDNTVLNPSLKSAFESRLARYALAGGALLGLPAAADAGIIYSGVQNLTIDTSLPLAVNFNPLVDAINDVTFTATAAGPDSDISMTPAASNAVNLGPLSFGSPITMANTTDTVGGTLVHKTCCVSYSGPWAGTINTPAYVGLRFTAGGQDYLGWAQLTLRPNIPDATLVDWAYEDTPETSILAGATGVPEPSTLTLFALGAAGVLAVRRRRAA